MRRWLLLVGWLALVMGPLTAVAGTLVTPSSKAAFQGLIDGQIAAFRANDAQAAFRVVDPDLRSKFGTAEQFMQVVQVGYRPVYAPRSYRFGEAMDLDSTTAGQWLHVVGPDGERVDALYLLERQPDGSWRTSGCLLYEPGPQRPGV